MQLIDIAIAYAARGWSIIPVVDKRARSANGLWAVRWSKWVARRPDEAQLRRLFRRKCINGLAVITGWISDWLTCRDFDTLSSYSEWARAFPQLARTLPTVKTGRGYHVYFRAMSIPANKRHLYFAHAWDYAKYADGEYSCSNRHYFVLPPSVHPKGGNYAWIVPLPDGELPLIDPVAAGLLVPLPVKPIKERKVASVGSESTLPVSTVPINSIAFDKCPRHVQEAIRATLPTGYGQRDNAIFRFATRLKCNMPELDGLTPLAIADRLRDYAHTWYELACPVISTKSWLVTQEAFYRAIKRVVKGKRAYWNQIVETFKARTPDCVKGKERLWALCQVAQEHWGQLEHWPLSGEIAGKAIGCSQEAAAKHIRKLVSEGKLFHAKEYGGKGSGMAAEYWIPVF